MLWALIKSADLHQQVVLGGLMVSDMHTNFHVNYVFSMMFGCIDTPLMIPWKSLILDPISVLFFRNPLCDSRRFGQLCERTSYRVKLSRIYLHYAMESWGDATASNALSKVYWVRHMVVAEKNFTWFNHVSASWMGQLKSPPTNNGHWSWVWNQARAMDASVCHWWEPPDKP